MEQAFYDTGLAAIQQTHLSSGVSSLEDTVLLYLADKSNFMVDYEYIAVLIIAC